MSLLAHFELAAQPFGVTPDPRFMYASATHREALACLLHGIASDRGFTALMAEPGMGKTTLLFHLLQTLKGKARTAFLFQTLCTPQEFLGALLADLDIDDAGSVSTMQSKLNEYLLQASCEGRQVVVIIDEAQNLDDRVLEVIRMLSNFETSNRKLMHVVLAGQPELAKRLVSENLAQLRQRISIAARLDRLNAEDAREYIEHRLRVAGRRSTQKSLFTAQAYELIAEQARGIPRNINNLCFNAMSLACAVKKHIVDREMVQETIRDLDLAAIVPLPSDVRADIGSESRARSRFNLASSVSVEWRRAALVTLAAVPLVCLGFLTGKALGERRTPTSVERPVENAVIPSVAAPTPPEVPPSEQKGQSLAPKEANETRRLGSDLDAVGKTQTLASKRRNRTRRAQRATQVPTVSPTGWSAKFSNSLQPPRVSSIARTESGSLDLRLAELLVPVSAQGGKP